MRLETAFAVSFFQRKKQFILYNKVELCQLKKGERETMKKSIWILIIYFIFYCIGYCSEKVILRMEPQNSPPKIIRDNNSECNQIKSKINVLDEKGNDRQDRNSKENNRE